jgi:hypothetical protein
MRWFKKKTVEEILSPITYENLTAVFDQGRLEAEGVKEKEVNRLTMVVAKELVKKVTEKNLTCKYDGTFYIVFHLRDFAHISPHSDLVAERIGNIIRAKCYIEEKYLSGSLGTYEITVRIKFQVN